MFCLKLPTALYRDYRCQKQFVLCKLQVTLIKMCLNETYTKVRIGKHLSDTFHPKKGEDYYHFSSTVWNMLLGMCE